ncbi:MAG TPA: nuclear transport factor 2 family protein [Pyrinomonadaceae bacterium]|jgi:ketosteroid isomerase-like protein|nr:nuclear transport factor 2 family protein [Pyrinomonadaceae bacterium]
MKRALLLTLTFIAALFFISCAGEAVNNKPANANTANTNAAKTTAPAPTKEALMALETKAFEAWKNKDTKFWEGFLVDNYVGLDEHGKRVDKAGVIKMITEDKCEITKSAFSDEQMTPAGADAAIVTYKIAYEGKCGTQTLPPAMWSTSVYVRSGDTWKGAYHNEAMIIDPSAKSDAGTKPPPPPAEKKDEKKAAPETKSANAPDDKTPAPAEDPYIAVVKKGWEAWKNRDAKALGDSLAKDFVMINPLGSRLDSAGAVKGWSEQKCEIKNVSFDDAKSTAFGKDMAIVTLKGNAEGTCDGKPVPSLIGTYLLVKDGDNWKAAMIFESPVM